jgi:hypothetical protein
MRKLPRGGQVQGAQISQISQLCVLTEAKLQNVPRCQRSRHLHRNGDVEARTSKRCSASEPPPKRRSEAGLQCSQHHHRSGDKEAIAVPSVPQVHRSEAVKNSTGAPICVVSTEAKTKRTVAGAPAFAVPPRWSRIVCRGSGRRDMAPSSSDVHLSKHRFQTPFRPRGTTCNTPRGESGRCP